jgi:hypothetical protein
VIEFEAFPKLPRLNRSCVVTEKIDGSNAAIVIVEDGEFGRVRVGAQSRTRLITPGKQSDMAGFAAWVQEYQQELVNLLGPGRHFGEWYGAGIQRGYGLDHKRFALFNTDRWNPSFSDRTNGFGEVSTEPLMLGEHGIHTVPILRRFEFSTGMINAAVRELAIRGTQIPGATGPAEGVVVWHNAARQMFKVTVENDERPKGSEEWDNYL